MSVNVVQGGVSVGCPSPFSLKLLGFSDTEAKYNKKYLKKDKRRCGPWDFCYRDQSFINKRVDGYYFFSRKKRY